MPLTFLQPGESIGAHRGEVVVCIPVHGGHEHFVACLDSVVAHTPTDVCILVCDDASPDLRSQRHVEELTARAAAGPGSSRHHVLYMRQARTVGLPANANCALASAAPADVVLMNSDCEVAEGWLTGLRAAAYGDGATATATALTNNGTIVSVPERWTPARTLPDGLSLAEAAAAVRARSLALHPRLPTAIGHCMYLRRSALELVGDFDPSFSPGYGEEVDFSLRCMRHGLHHVAADEVLVLHHGGASFAADGTPNPLQAEHELVIAQRYPYYHEAVRAVIEDRAGTLNRALGAARRALRGVTVMLDARGTIDAGLVERAHALRGALEASGEARVVLITSAGEAAAAQPADVLHRLSPFSSAEELRSARAQAERLIVTQRDLLSYQDPGGSDSVTQWARRRMLTRATLALADHVAFPTRLARADALAVGLVSPERASVIYPAVGQPSPGRQVPRLGLEGLDGEREVIVSMGSDAPHRNRVFALRILDQLRRRHDWEGVLVLAGPRRARGSSAQDEAAILANDEALREAVIEVGVIGADEKARLLGRAALLLDPGIGEGFGTDPFEAAAHGVPCLWPEGTWLSELVPEERARIVLWDEAASAAGALELLRDERSRNANVSAIRGAGARLTVEASATALLALYNATCDAPVAVPAPPPEPVRGSPPLSADALRLVGPSQALPPDVERPLLALASHPLLGRPLFGALKAGYRGSRWLLRHIPTLRGV